MSQTQLMIQAALDLSNVVDALHFAEPVTHVYNPLNYAWKPHQTYIERFASSQKKVVFLGMNPGPWGMAQTGVPFGEIQAVSQWMKINEQVNKPKNEHAKRPIEGFSTTRSEVSGQRLWGLFAKKFPKAETFFEDHFVLNYCPLVFMEHTSKNRTPDKLPVRESAPLYQACDNHLRTCIEILQPEWIVGVGGFAQKRASEALSGIDIKHGKILHPSPASPAANRGWVQAATKQLLAQEIWKN
ncbi:MAG: uracil-DNA glycosylase family protein [Verrucomicrobiota bacterium]